MPTIYNSKLVFVDSQASVKQVVELHIEKSISSVLICDANECVAGIFTERDVVRKFVLLEKKDKLAARFNTVMSRPVIFVDNDPNLSEKIIDLHLQPLRRR